MKRISVRKREARNLPAYDILGQAKQYPNLNDRNSKLRLFLQVKVYGRVQHQISLGSRLFGAGRFVPFDGAQDRRFSAFLAPLARFTARCRVYYTKKCLFFNKNLIDNKNMSHGETMKASRRCGSVGAVVCTAMRAYPTGGCYRPA